MSEHQLYIGVRSEAVTGQAAENSRWNLERVSVQFKSSHVNDFKRWKLAILLLVNENEVAYLKDVKFYDSHSEFLVVFQVLCRVQGHVCRLKTFCSAECSIIHSQVSTRDGLLPRIWLNAEQNSIVTRWAIDVIHDLSLPRHADLKSRVMGCSLFCQHCRTLVGDDRWIRPVPNAAPFMRRT